MIRIAIVEDEKACADSLTEQLKRFSKEAKQEIACSVFTDGMNFISDYCPIYDVVFMDIEMPYLNGMLAAKKLREMDQNVSLIFVTRLAQYAVQGYEVEAAGYLLKPVEYFSLCRRMQKILSKHDFSQGKDFCIKTVSGLVKIDSEKLLYVEVIDHFLIYHTLHANHKAYGRLFEVEAQLPKELFFKCNKSYLVNLKFVGKITKSSVFIGDEEILVSRSKQKELMHAFNRYVEGTING